MVDKPHNPIGLDRQLCFALYSASKRFNHFYAEALAPFDLTYPQYITLLSLWEKSPVTVRELGTGLTLDSGTLTPLLKRMEKNGWVQRSRDPDDERQVLISLTLKAKHNRKEIFARVNSCMDLLDMNTEEYDAAVDQLHDVDDRLASINDTQAIRMIDQQTESE